MLQTQASSPLASSLEEVLLQVATSFSRQADDLLDLREYGVQRKHPGKCVDCYFRLHTAEPEKMTNLAPLREWLERNIEIVAADQHERLLEKIPLRLDTHDLESFCHKVINFLRDDRAFQAPLISLNFAFKA